METCTLNGLSVSACLVYIVSQKGIILVYVCIIYNCLPLLEYVVYKHEER